VRIVLDLQGAQSDSRFRGIGRYSLALAQAIVAGAGRHEVWLALSGRFPESLDPLRDAFAGLVPPERIRIFELPGPVAELDPANAWRAHAAELVRENFLAGLRPDIVHASTLFEGFHNEVVASIGRLHAGVPTAVTLYDLIPLLNPQKYLQSPAFRAIYARRMQSLRRADLILTISEASRNEAIEALQIPDERIVNISAGVSPFFKRVEVSTEDKASLMAAFGLQRPFLLYAGGLEPRKNLEGLLEAYSSLPKCVRAACQLALIGDLQPDEVRRLAFLKRKRELAHDEVISVGYVSDQQLLLLYSTCIAFVLPSLHEGFGLPAVEAMACGAPVIGSNLTSVSEIINREDALFDPHRPKQIATRLNEVLTDSKFRQSLSLWGLDRARAFTWNASAATALQSFEALAAKSQAQRGSRVSFADGKCPLRLAFLSPLPPVRSGIAGYAARLLPYLARHYEITCIVDQAEVTDPWVVAGFAIRDIRWFELNAGKFDRVLYHFGNSPAHKHMFDLLARHPGVVTLHDFYLSSLLKWMEETGYAGNAFVNALYAAHGFSCFDHLKENPAETVNAYPCNAQVLQESVGVIVHSQHAIDYARQCYGEQMATRFRRVDFLPFPPEACQRKAARARLGLPDSAFLVCSFGWIAPCKLNDRLLNAWLDSPLAADETSRLIFVGGNEGGDYGKRLLERIAQCEAGSRITITDYVDEDRYRDYLASADIAVQLRTGSRGETSAAIFDCLRGGVPLVVNAHGAVPELPDEVVLKLPDQFSDARLSDALVLMKSDPYLRQKLVVEGQLYVRRTHHPERVADLYREAIEHFYADSPSAREQSLVEAIGHYLAPIRPAATDLAATAVAIAGNRERLGRPQILIDVTHVAASDLRTGIQRVTRAMAMAIIANPPDKYRVEPVRAVADQYLYARRFTSRCLDLPDAGLEDDPVEVGSGDLFLGIDWCPDVLPTLKGWFSKQRHRGLRTVFMVYDILPLLRPEVFLPAVGPLMANWLSALVEIADGIVCDSRTVADELYDWLARADSPPVRRFPIGFSHLGGDLRASLPSTELPPDAPALFSRIARYPAFLMVGTLEPRKGHRQALRALERLWADGVEASLVIVGNQGWMIEDLAAEIRVHPQHGTRLFWLQAASDELLEQIYRRARGLLAASEGEGFGLPLIEAACYGLPIIARAIPVFQEVAGEHAYYFHGREPDRLADALRTWLALGERIPKPHGIKWLTWCESSRQLIKMVLDARWYKWWPGADHMPRP